jgi:serine/threonine protein kinase/formylglycine-generating enzyme required for sulfatase activity
MDSSLSSGTKLGRYEIRSKVGEGGMGEVYLAEDTQLGRRVAIKLLPPATISDEQAGKRLIREARAAATLDHPNICSVYEVSEADGRLFIAMQYVEGETLNLRIKREDLDLPETLSIATQVADALAEAHAHGVIHRDIKPANIMITSRGQAKVMDFGLAKVIPRAHLIQSEAETEAILSTPGAIMGTLPYMSPEQVRAEALDGRSDIFSFGVVLYEIVSGKQPFACASSAATASAILTRELPPLERFSRDVPAELERIVSKALRKDKEERYQTARDLLIDLRSLTEEMKFAARLERSSPPDPSRSKSAALTEGPVIIDSTSPPGARTTAANEKLIRETKKSVISAGRRISRRTWLVALAAVVVMAAGIWFFWNRAKVRWARDQVPRIEQLAKTQKFFQAYDLAVAATKYLPNDPTIARLMPTISDTISVTTEPAGAQIYLKAFAPDDAGKFPPRQLVGTTPIDNLRVARGEYILYIEKDGYAKVEQTISGATKRSGSMTLLPPPIRVEQKLIAADKMPDRMVSVPGGDYRLVAWGRPTDARIKLDDYFIDKYEVTNQDYKEFINAGGYLKKEFWKYLFNKGGKTLSRDEAMKEFKDRTGLPGPRSWSSQNFPEGKADYPVTDITWYEASAYAAFRGKQLPTIFQWEKAARNGNSSNFGSYMPWGIFYSTITRISRTRARCR